ncbi:hypothetical protein BN2476_240209 [Paraburkholderia piptadeniae]|uniref:Uncharacterized protein n=1 Tax=Paraburkholderia piptadeniae TaxID=1701573 RepID=A0A1N7RZI1_9BURK|nr:hypothetical protein BN2476_240209 [Paraburkholderia piptadeniae]
MRERRCYLTRAMRFGSYTSEHFEYWQSAFLLLTIDSNVTSDKSQPTGARCCSKHSADFEEI